MGRDGAGGVPDGSGTRDRRKGHSDWRCGYEIQCWRYRGHRVFRRFVRRMSQLQGRYRAVLPEAMRVHIQRHGDGQGDADVWRLLQQLRRCRRLCVEGQGHRRSFRRRSAALRRHNDLFATQAIRCRPGAESGRRRTRRTRSHGREACRCDGGGGYCVQHIAGQGGRRPRSGGPQLRR